MSRAPGALRRRRLGARGRSWGAFALTLALALGPARPVLAQDAEEMSEGEAAPMSGEEGESEPMEPPQTLTSEGLAQLLVDLELQQEELRLRTLTIEERERSLAELEGVVALRLEEIEKIRMEIEGRIAAFEANLGDRVKKLAKVYAVMPPGQVAGLLREIPVELATSVLAKMKDKNSAAVLAALPEREAAAFSQRIVRPLSDTE